MNMMWIKILYCWKIVSILQQKVHVYLKVMMNSLILNKVLKHNKIQRMLISLIILLWLQMKVQINLEIIMVLIKVNNKNHVALNLNLKLLPINKILFILLINLINFTFK